MKSRNTVLLNLLLCQCFFLFSISPAFASENETAAIITSLTNKIASADNEKEKGRLYLYRARQHAKIHKAEEALIDYRLALASTPAGWIQNEYGHYLYHCGEYEEAYKTAVRVIENFPHLAGEAGSLKKKAGEKYREQYYREHPPTIVMDTDVDPNRLTRHDLIRKMQPVQNTYSYPSLSKASAPGSGPDTPSKTKSTTRRS